MKLSVIFAIIVFSSQLGCDRNSETVENTKPSLKEEIKVLSDLAASKARLPDEAIVEQNAKVIEIANDSREKILKHPMPSFTFVFPCEFNSQRVCEGESVKVDLPQEGIKLVEKYWEKTIKIRYIEAAEDNLNYEQMLKLLTAHSEAGLSFEGEILDVKIKSPAGVRSISTFEADQLNRLIISFADRIVDEALRNKKARSRNSV